MNLGIKYDVFDTLLYAEYISENLTLLVGMVFTKKNLKKKLILFENLSIFSKKKVNSSSKI